jgi:cysteine desulfurase/selenocysteine lyase
VANLLDDDGAIRPLELASVREEFPIVRERCYLNNASIGPLSNPVVAAIQAFLHDVRDHGRNNYPHWCRYADEHIKTRLGALIGAGADELAFVKNTTEGLVTVANGLDWRPGDNVVVPDIEYPSNVYCWMRLAKLGVAIKWARSDRGRVTVDAIAEAIDSRTRLVSVSAVQFSNGFRHDVALTSELCRERNVLLNLDAIQWIGALDMDVRRYHVDFMSAGGHKWLLAPIGTGLFYCNRESLDLLDPPSVGYHSVDKHEAHMDYDLVYRPNAGRFEEALVNFPGIWGLDAATRIILGLGPKIVEEHIIGLVGYAAEALQARGWQIVSPLGNGERSGLLSFREPGVDMEAVALHLARRGVDVAVRDGAIRISPSYYNTPADIDQLVRELPR